MTDGLPRRTAEPFLSPSINALGLFLASVMLIVLTSAT
jgi:hypothetical protein